MRKYKPPYKPELDLVEQTKFNRIEFKTVAKFCTTVVATTPFSMPILVQLVLVPLQSSETNTNSTKNGIKIEVVATTMLQNFGTVSN